jgi:hypothetical protein
VTPARKPAGAPAGYRRSVNVGKVAYGRESVRPEPDPPLLTPTEIPPTVTGGALTGTGSDGRGTVTVVVVGVVVVVLLVDVVVVLPVDAPPEALPDGVDALPPAEAVTGRLGRPGTKLPLPLPPRGSEGSEVDVAPDPPDPVTPATTLVTPSSSEVTVPESRVPVTPL